MSYYKYYLYKEQISYDSGTTWQDTGNQAPSGNPIGTYSTLEECEGITSCTCADFTYPQTAFTVSSAATSVTFSYTGCTKPDLTSAATYNWVTIGSHTYNTGTSVGNIIANISANTSSSRTATLNLSLSGTTCQNLIIFQENGDTPVVSPKYVLTLINSPAVSAECDSTSSVITSGEVSSQYSGSLISAQIGQCVTSIGYSAFRYCNSLTGITIPDSVTTIGGYAFSVCNGLTSVNIPDSVTSIGENAFQHSNYLNSVIIPNNVTSFGQQAFSYCSGLRSVTIGTGVTSIRRGTFYYCIGLTGITIPNNVTSIDKNAFHYCSDMTNVVIGTGVTTIGDDAFSYCYGLTSVTIEATTPPTLGTDVFSNTNNCPIYVPAASVNVYKSAWSTYGDRIQPIP